jgi:4-diphosphocytidyl-2-C-methyl-D-erythritol kinase
MPLQRRPEGPPAHRVNVNRRRAIQGRARRLRLFSGVCRDAQGPFAEPAKGARRGVQDAERGGRVRTSIRLCAPAKVNLALWVGRRRPDGYHELHTVFQALALHDRIALETAEELDLRADDPLAGDGERNLGWRAAEALRRAAGIRAGARIRIHKRIPVQGGLGGGSSDAAAVLVGCNRLWRLGWSRARLAEIGVRVGADVPFFLLGGTAMGTGRGERLRRLPPLPAWPVVVGLSGPGVPTAEAYAAMDARGAGPEVDVSGVAAACRDRPRARSLAARRDFAARLGNAFEAVVLPQRPDIAALRLRLVDAGALAAMLSGSGAAVWALAPSLHWARSQARILRAEGVWAAATRLASGRAGICANRGRWA